MMQLAYYIPIVGFESQVSGIVGKQRESRGSKNQTRLQSKLYDTRVTWWAEHIVLHIIKLKQKLTIRQQQQ